MSEPVSCQWCGSAQKAADGDDILFRCGSWHSGGTPEYQWSQCKLNVAEQRIRRALEVLQKAQRHHPENAGEMEACSQGDWIEIDDVVKAIQILQERQQ